MTPDLGNGTLGTSSETVAEDDCLANNSALDARVWPRLAASTRAGGVRPAVASQALEAASSPMSKAGAEVCDDGVKGNAAASATYKPDTPRTCKSSLQTPGSPGLATLAEQQTCW